MEGGKRKTELDFSHTFSVFSGEKTQRYLGGDGGWTTLTIFNAVFIYSTNLILRKDKFFTS